MLYVTKANIFPILLYNLLWIMKIVNIFHEYIYVGSIFISLCDQLLNEFIDEVELNS